MEYPWKPGTKNRNKEGDYPKGEDRTQAKVRKKSTVGGKVCAGGRYRRLEGGGRDWQG